MAWSFNVFTGNLDQTGSGAVVFEGEVETFADLPETQGDPAVGASYLVRTSTGVWLVNRRQAGIWIRKNNTGVRATDWEYGGDYPVNSVNGQTGNVSLTAADVGASAPGHTHAAADVISGTFDNARINFASPPAIGNTTPNTGAFTTLAANSTVTTSAPALDVSQTLNGTTATFFRLANLTFNNIASSVNSEYINCETGGISHFAVRRSGIAISPSFSGSNGFRAVGNGNSGGQVILSSNGHYCWNDSTTSTFATQDLILRRDAAGILAQHNLANPQAFRIYNTTDAGLTNFERGFMRWSSNVLQIGTEAGGTGSARAMEFHTAGINRFDIAANGNITLRGFTTITSGNTFNINGGEIRLQTTAGADTAVIGRDAANVIALRFGTLAQSLNIYNTFTSSTNHERLRLGWSSNVAIIGTEKGSGGGTARALEFQTDGVTRLTIATGGGITVAGSSFTVTGSGTNAVFSAAGSGIQLSLRNISTSADSSIAGITLTGNLTASTRNIVTDTTTGTRIGTGTTQLLGFWNATPSAQPAAVADATDAASTQARLNDLLARLRTIGIIAT